MHEVDAEAAHDVGERAEDGVAKNRSRRFGERFALLRAAHFAFVGARVRERYFEMRPERTEEGDAFLRRPFQFRLGRSNDRHAPQVAVETQRDDDAAATIEERVANGAWKKRRIRGFVDREKRLELAPWDALVETGRALIARADRSAHQIVALERIRGAIDRKLVRDGHDENEQHFVDVLRIAQNAHDAFERFGLRAPGALALVEARVGQRQSDVERERANRSQISVVERIRPVE